MRELKHAFESRSMPQHTHDIADNSCATAAPARACDDPCATEHKHSSHSEHSHDPACCNAFATPPLARLPAATLTSNGVKTSIRIMEMDCPTEEGLIRSKLEGMPEVFSLQFNLIQRTLTIVHTPNACEPILAAIRALGFVPELPDSAATPASTEASRLPARRGWALAIAAAAALASEGITWLGFSFDFSAWLAGGLAACAIAVCGLGTYKKGWVAIRNGQLNINALMSIAVTGAMILGQWPEAAMVMILFTLAELIEAKSLDRARHAIQQLIQLAPDTATVLQSDGTWASIDARNVAIDARVRVEPGERIALDGEIVEGRSAINQAPITGESLPIDKTTGDAVFAGTINETGSFIYRVTVAANNTTLARIIHAVEQAQGARAPTQRFVDRFAQIYTPIIFALALLVAVLPPLVFDAAWRDWIYRALVMLVIACPCALVISTPVTIVSGLAAAARRGILIKGGVYLEQGRKLTWLALDKTGTITRGKPVQTDFELRTKRPIQDCQHIAASLAGRSNHPVSRAIVAAMTMARTKTSTEATPFEVSHFEALLGRGVTGVINGEQYWLGNHRLVEEKNRCSPALEARLDELEQQGKTVVILFNTTNILALFAVADMIKETSRAAIAELHHLGIRTVMLTGDNPHTAQAIAQKAGIDDARGNQMPEDKLQAIDQLLVKGAVVGMAGDGINDAPALARASIGFAMGAMGADAAIETADVALMDDDLRKISTFVRLSRATHHILVQNIVFALAIKALFLGLTFAGLGTMWMAVFADAGASLIVVGNGLRLLRR